MTRYRKSWTEVLKEVRESIETKEAVVVETDYKYDGKVVKITKKNFSKVHKDYKNSTKGKERMLINDPKTSGTISVPVQFEEVELDEMKWEAGVVYHQEYKNGDRSYFRADSVQKNKRWKGMSVDEIGGQQKKPKNNTADERVQGWEITPKNEIPKSLKEEVELDESLGLQMKMAFDDAKIKVKGAKGGKLVIDKKDKKKVTDVLSKSLKKGSNVKRAIDKFIMFEEVEEGKSYLNGTAYPATVDTLRKIVKDKQHQTVMFDKGKAMVDLFTASAMVQVYDALKPATKKKFEDMIKTKEGFMKSQAFAMKMAK